MNIPGYDEMILRGPEERPEPVMVDCEACKGAGFASRGYKMFECTECGGLGEVEEPAEEPDDDGEFESRRDAAMEDDQ